MTNYLHVGFYQCRETKRIDDEYTLRKNRQNLRHKQFGTVEEIEDVISMSF